MAREGGDVVGMLTLITLRIPTGVVSHIDNVVVDVRSRGLGAGRLLVEHALTLAKSAGARHVGLTSRPARAAANGLYRSLGFQQLETNVHRYTVDHC